MTPEQIIKQEIAPDIVSRMMGAGEKSIITVESKDSVRKDFSDPEKSYHSIRIIVTDSRNRGPKLSREFVYELTDVPEPCPGLVLRNILYEIIKNPGKNSVYSHVKLKTIPSEKEITDKTDVVVLQREI